MPQINLHDKHNNLIGEVFLNNNNKAEGKIKFKNCPKQLRELFTNYETLVNENVLSLLDDLEHKIDQWELRLNNIRIYNVQVMNKEDISFTYNN